MEFSSLLSENILLLDGVMPFTQTNKSECYEMLNITLPMDVLDAHSEYISAGADVITANTGGANALRLSQFGLNDRVEEIIISGVALAKEAASCASKKVLVAASIKSTCENFIDSVDMPDKLYASFYEQCSFAAHAGADIILVETMSDLREARLALLAARACCNLPVLMSFVLERDSNTFTLNPPETLALVSSRLGASMCGIGCGLSPDDMFRGYSMLAGSSIIPTFAIPEAARINGEPITPDEMASSMLPYLHCGASMIGGSTKTTPKHIKAMRALLDDYHGNSHKAIVSNDYVCSPMRRLTLQDAESGNILNVSRLSIDEASEQITKEPGKAAHIDFAEWVAKDIRMLLYNILKRTGDLPLAFHVHSAEQAEAALFAYPGIAPIYAHGDAYRVLRIAAKYGAEVIS